MHCWTETEYLHLDCYLGLSRGATASNESAPRQKLNLFTICSVDYIAMRIICIWWYIALHSINGCVDIINFFVRSKGLKKLEKNSMELWENNMRWWNSATQIYWDGRKGKSVSRPTAHGRERLVCKDFPTQTLQHHHSGATTQQQHLTPILTPTLRR